MHVPPYLLLKFEGKSQKNMVKQVADNGEIRGISML
jgi:hypothetical protein